MVEADSLVLEEGGSRLIDGLSFTLEEGRIYALCGVNGSGKTTLIRTLNSYFPHYGGSLRFNGKELSLCGRKEKEKLHAVLPQNIPVSSVSTSALFEHNAGAAALLDEFSLSHLMKRNLASLSGGERVMVFLSLMLSRDALLYSFDESEANLDAKYRKLIEERMRKLAEEKKTVLASFHDINKALEISDELIVLSKGRLVFKGTPAMFIADDIGERFFSLTLRKLTDEDGRQYSLFF